MDQEEEPRSTSGVYPRKGTAHTAVHLEIQHMRRLLVAHGAHTTVAVAPSDEAHIEPGLEQHRQAQAEVRVHVRPHTCAVVAGARIGTLAEPGSDRDLPEPVRIALKAQGGMAVSIVLLVRIAASPHKQVCSAVACASFVGTSARHMTVHDCARTAWHCMIALDASRVRRTWGLVLQSLYTPVAEHNESSPAYRRRSDVKRLVEAGHAGQRRWAWAGCSIYWWYLAASRSVERSELEREQRSAGLEAPLAVVAMVDPSAAPKSAIYLA